MFRTLTIAQRGALRALREAEASHAQLALACAEAVELLLETCHSCSPTPDAPSVEALAAAERAAWDRLSDVGLSRDGQPGEAIDGARHVVIDGSAPRGRLPNRVKSVWRCGVLLRSVRIRKAEVVAEYLEGADGTHRD